jgi:hypothetical protein
MSDAASSGGSRLFVAAARASVNSDTARVRELPLTMIEGINGPSSLQRDDRRDEASDCMLLGLVLPPRFDTDWIP